MRWRVGKTSGLNNATVVFDESQFAIAQMVEKLIANS